MKFSVTFEGYYSRHTYFVRALNRELAIKDAYSRLLRDFGFEYSQLNCECIRVRHLKAMA